MIKMSRRALSRCILSILLTAYLVTAVSMTRTDAAARPPEGLSIVINDSLDTHFVSAADVDAALGTLSAAIDTTPAADSTPCTSNSACGHQTAYRRPGA